MNKKILAAFAVLVVSLPVCAQKTGTFMPKYWQEALNQKIDQATFDDAIGILDNPLVLAIPVTKQFFPVDSNGADLDFHNSAHYRRLTNAETYPTTTGCKAYVLDEHWVIAGATCLWNARHTIEFTEKSGKFATGLVEPDSNRKNLYINSTNIPWKENLFVQPHETNVPHVILVRVPEVGLLSKQLKRWPKVNILALNKVAPAQLKSNNFYINTARFGLNAVRKRTLADGSISTLLSVKEKFGNLSGVSTDPLMYLHNGKLYWIGVNNGVTNLRYGDLSGDWDGESSNDYYAFTPADLAFIKQTISKHDPAAWERIKVRQGLEIW